MARFVIGSSMYVVLEGTAGDVLLCTPLLSGQLACRSTILSIRLCSLVDACYLRSVDDQGRHSFALHVRSGDPIAFSPLYSSVDEREWAVDEVRRYASKAFVTHGTLDARPPRVPHGGFVVVRTVNVRGTKPEDDGGAAPADGDAG